MSNEEVAQAILNHFGYIVLDNYPKGEAQIGEIIDGLASWDIRHPFVVSDTATMEEAQAQHRFIVALGGTGFHFQVRGRLYKLTTD